VEEQWMKGHMVGVEEDGGLAVALGGKELQRFDMQEIRYVV
jgi:hypothetical protein